VSGQRPLAFVKAALQEELEKLQEAPGNRALQIVVDVDPR